MKKEYVSPVFEKVTFDYSILTAGTSQCYESVINQRTEAYACDPSVSTPLPIGWTKEQTGV